MTMEVTDREIDPVTAAIRVSIPDRGLRQDLRAIGIVWRRELIRFKSDRLRAVTSLVQPVLFLFVLGTGLSTLAGKGMPPGVSFKTFIYPGVLAMSVLFTALFSAASIARGRASSVSSGRCSSPRSAGRRSSSGNASAARPSRRCRESSFSPWPGRRMYPTTPFCFSP
jgi:hypothetical protein